jgi:hypothetical protein
MIYGANGYTGELIAREAKKRGAHPVLAGRDAAKIAKLATDLSLPSKVFALDKPPDIVAALQGIGLVLNCAGPFSKTANPLSGHAWSPRPTISILPVRSISSKAHTALMRTRRRLVWSCVQGLASM